MKRKRLSPGCLLCVIGLVVTVGCKEPKNSGSGIIGKTTNEVEEFDPNAGAEISDGKMKPTNPLNPAGALNAYGPAVEKIAAMGIDRAITLFHAEHGRYPRDYDEFMKKIIRRYNYELPVLPAKKRYQYDVENHKLVIVEAEEQTE